MKKYSLVIVTMIFIMSVSCSKDSDDVDIDNGVVTFELNGERITYNKANSFIKSDQTIVLSLANDLNHSIGMELEASGNDVINYSVANASDREVSVVYSGPETPADGYSMNSIYAELPELDRKGSYGITLNPINNNKISGTFEFVVYSEDNTDSLVVRNGIFTGIPQL